MVEKDLKKDLFIVKEVATQTEPVIVDVDNNVLSIHQALVLILNKLDKLERGLL